MLLQSVFLPWERFDVVLGKLISLDFHCCCVFFLGMAQDGMEQLRQLGCDAFIEIGPEPVLLEFLGLQLRRGDRCADEAQQGCIGIRNMVEQSQSI